MASVTISHAKNITLGDWSGTVTVGNSTGGTVTAAASDLARPSDWNSNHQATISIFESDFGDIEFFEPFPLPNTNSTLSAPGIGTWYLNPFVLPVWVESGYLMMPEANASWFMQAAALSGSTNTGAVSRQMTLYDRAALYKPMDGTNASKMSTVWTANCDLFATQYVTVGGVATNLSSFTVSNYATVSIPYQWDISGGASYSTFTASGTLSTAGSSLASSSINSLVSVANNYVSGSRVAFFPLAATLGQGNYVFGHVFSSVTASSTTGGGNIAAGTMLTTQSILGLLDNNMQVFKQIGKSTTQSNSAIAPFQGYLATTTSGASGTIASSDIVYTTGRMYWAKDERSRG